MRAGMGEWQLASLRRTPPSLLPLPACCQARAQPAWLCAASRAKTSGAAVLPMTICSAPSLILPRPPTTLPTTTRALHPGPHPPPPPRNACAKEDLYYPHPLIQDVLWWTLYQVGSALLLWSRCRQFLASHSMQSWGRLRHHTPGSASPTASSLPPG